jgi:Domain of unknown function (DUF4190)
MSGCAKRIWRSVSVMTQPSDQPTPAQPPPYPYPTSGPAYPAPPPVPYSGYSAPPPPTGPRNGLGIAALIIAIVGLFLMWSVALGVILGVVAVILGFVGYGRVKRGEANNGVVAIVGIALGFLGIVLGLAWIPIWVAIFNQIGASSYIDCLSKAGNDSAKIQQCADQFRQHLQQQYSITLTP